MVLMPEIKQLASTGKREETAPRKVEKLSNENRKSWRSVHFLTESRMSSSRKLNIGMCSKIKLHF